jgi:hypothetical protein
MFKRFTKISNWQYYQSYLPKFGRNIQTLANPVEGGLIPTNPVRIREEGRKRPAILPVAQYDVRIVNKQIFLYIGASAKDTLSMDKST